MLKLLDQDCSGHSKLQRNTEIHAEIDKKIHKIGTLLEKSFLEQLVLVQPLSVGL